MTIQNIPSRTEQLAAFVHGLSYDAIPPEVIEKAKCHFLDTVGVAFAGAAVPLMRRIAHSFEAIDASRDCTVVGMDIRLSAANAALVNGMNAHTFDYDDTHLGSITHPSGALVPTIMAVGEQHRANGRAMLTALVAGYEIMTRMGLATRPRQIFERGFQVTTLLGSMGAAAVSGKIMGLDSQQLAHALGLAASQAGGIRQFSADGEVSEGKRFHSGWPAHSGILAAHLSANGLTAPRRVLEGERGLYKTHLGEQAVDEDALVRGLGAEWETMNLSTKVHSCCQAIQAFLDTTRDIMRDNTLRADDIKHITLHTRPENRFVCEPLEEKRRPGSSVAALLALPFCAAVMVTKGYAGPQSFGSEAIRDPEVLSVADRITYDTSLTDPWEAGMTMETQDGRRIVKRVEHYRGGAEDPLSINEYVEKFTGASSTLLTPDRQKAIVKMLLEMDEPAWPADCLKMVGIEKKGAAGSVRIREAATS